MSTRVSLSHLANGLQIDICGCSSFHEGHTTSGPHKSAISLSIINVSTHRADQEEVLRVQHRISRVCPMSLKPVHLHMSPAVTDLRSAASIMSRRLVAPTTTTPPPESTPSISLSSVESTRCWTPLASAPSPDPSRLLPSGQRAIAGECGPLSDDGIDLVEE
eukprot:753676-Hanusia_phi.AAC.7